MAPSPAERSAAWLRWRSARLVRSLQQRAVLDVHHDPARALHLSSWQRSGSTWLARVATSAPATRMVYEPSNLRQQLFVGGEPHLLPLPMTGPDGDLGPDGPAFDAALRGSISTTWTNPVASDRVVRRRVVKDVRTVGALPWIAARYPSMPVVLLLRHPIAVAHSIIDLGWGLDGDLRATLGDEAAASLDARAASLVLEVARWSAHHAFALTHEAAARVHVILYEDLAADPTSELERLRIYLEGFEHWHDWRPDERAIAGRSKTSFRRDETSSERWIDSWSDEWDPATIDRALGAVAATGLDVLYGRDPMPRVTGAEVQRSLTSA